MTTPDHPAVPKSTHWERVGAETSWGRYMSAVERTAIECASRMAGERGEALEVGCEGGRWSRMLAKDGWQMTCTDVNAVSLEVCRQKLPSAHCILVRSGDRTLPVNSGQFSLLLCVQVPPVIESDWFLAEAGRVLQPGGILVGTFLNRRSWRAWASRCRRSTRFYSASYPVWRRRLRMAEFSLVYERGYCWAPFSRTSNSSLVPFFTKAERCSGITRLTSLSPWVAFIARNQAQDSKEKKWKTALESSTREML